MKTFCSNPVIVFHFSCVYTFSVMRSYLGIWVNHDNYRLRPGTFCTTTLIIRVAESEVKYLTPPPNSDFPKFPTP